MDIIQLLISSGLSLLWIPIVWLPNMLPAAQAWRLCFINGKMPRFRHALMGIWLGRSVNNLLPVATIGGEIVKARLMTLKGVNVNDASASVMVDKTLQALAVVVWGLIGVGLLLYHAVDHNFAMIALSGFAVLTLCVTGLYFLQRAGMLSLMTKFGEALIESDAWEGVSQSAKDVDAIVLQIYNDKPRFFLAVAYKSLNLALQTTEVWLACYLFGQPISLAEAMMLKSLTATISDIAFVIPNAYGIQEGAFIMVGSLLGLSPEFSLAVSLAVRVRELSIDLPGLLLWHQIEAKQLIKQRTVDQAVKS